jgi:hypothetical protein
MSSTHAQRIGAALGKLHDALDQRERVAEQPFLVLPGLTGAPNTSAAGSTNARNPRLSPFAPGEVPIRN